MIGPRSSRAPTARQVEVLRAIHALTVQAGFPPTYRELSRFFGWSAGAPRDHVAALQDRGLLRDSPQYTKRCLVLTDRARELIGAEEPERVASPPADVTAARIVAPVLQPFRCGFCAAERFNPGERCPVCGVSR